MNSITLPKYKFRDIESNKHLDRIEREFSYYLTANELEEKADSVKVAHLRLAFDSPTNDIIDMLKIENITVKKIFEELKKELMPKENLAYRQYQFFDKKQDEQETFNEFYIRIKDMASMCNFGNKTDEILKCKIVQGVKDEQLRERLYRTPELSLTEVISYCRASEDAKNKLNNVKTRKSEEGSVEIIHNRKPLQWRDSAKQSNNKPQKWTNNNFRNNTQDYNSHNFRNNPQDYNSHNTYKRNPSYQRSSHVRNTYTYRCNKCNTTHASRQCPAFGSRCEKCRNYNHFSHSCRKRSRPQNRVHTLHEEDDSDDPIQPYGVLDTLMKHVPRESNTGEIKDTGNIDDIKDTGSWIQEFRFGSVYLRFKLDSGADINVIKKSDLHLMDPDQKLKMYKNTQQIHAFGGYQLEIIGNVDVMLRNKGKTHLTTFAVMKDRQGIRNILGCVASEELGLIKRVERVTSVDSQLFDENQFINKYKDTFEGVGTFPKKYKIEIDESEIPSNRPPRRVAYSLMEKLKTTLDKLVQSQIIEPVEGPKSWCSNLVIREKPNGDLRLCLDPTDLNKCIKREYFLIPTLEEIKTKLTGKKYFSVIDLKDGFHQIQLDDKSKDLCTFSTPLGYYRYLRVPFGLTTSPEIFMKYNTECFKGIPDLIIYFDDLLIASKDKESHTKTLTTLFDRIREMNIKVNKSKLQLIRSEIKYLGHIFNELGCKIDPERVKAIQNLKEPKNVKELQSLLGMFNYMREFIPNMADITAPLRILLKKSTSWHWSDNHQKTFEKLKSIVSSTPVLQNFDPNKEVTLQVDSSNYGTGCTLLQDSKPVAFASRSLTETEKKYPQIEKEALAIKFACRKFHNYIWGKEIQIQTDHLPLVSIFRKNLSEIVSERLVKIRLLLMRYNLTVTYLPGKQMFIADLLSRNLANNTYNNEIELTGYIHNIYQQDTLFNIELVKKETKLDQSLSQVAKHCIEGWPKTKSDLPNDEILRHYFKIKDELIFTDGLLYVQNRLIIPNKLKQLALSSLHSGHLGVTKTNLRAKQTYYWINISNDIEKCIKNCIICQENRPAQSKVMLLPHDVPDRPFQKLSLDIMTFKGVDYLVIIDNYSKWIELFKLSSKKCSEIINKLKSLFSNFGVPEIIMSDNSPFLSHEINLFSREYNIDWLTSSPHHPISNGQAERAVQICKDILKKADSLNIHYLELLMEYRATPISSIGVSPSEMLMGRLIKTKMLVSSNNLKPIENLAKLHSEIKTKLSLNQENNKNYYNRNCRPEKEFIKNENILLHEGKKWIRGKVLDKTRYPRSYNIITEKGQNLRRNISVMKPTSLPFQENKIQNFDYDEIFETWCHERSVLRTSQDRTFLNEPQTHIVTVDVHNSPDNLRQFSSLSPIEPNVLTGVQDESLRENSFDEFHEASDIDLLERPIVQQEQNNLSSSSEEEIIVVDHNYTPHRREMRRYPERNRKTPLKLFDYDCGKL